MAQLNGIEATVECWKHLHGLKLDLLDAVHIGVAVNGACFAVGSVVSFFTFLFLFLFLPSCTFAFFLATSAFFIFRTSFFSHLPHCRLLKHRKLALHCDGRHGKMQEEHQVRVMSAAAN